MQIDTFAAPIITTEALWEILIIFRVMIEKRKRRNFRKSASDHSRCSHINGTGKSDSGQKIVIESDRFRDNFKHFFNFSIVADRSNYFVKPLISSRRFTQIKQHIFLYAAKSFRKIGKRNFRLLTFLHRYF